MQKKTAYDGEMFVDRLMEHARKKGIKTQKACGEYLGMENSISNWKRGKSTPTAADLVHISNAFSCTVDSLLGLKNQPVDCASLLKMICLLDQNTDMEISYISPFNNGEETFCIHWNLRDAITSKTAEERYWKTFALLDFLADYSKLREIQFGENAMSAAVDALIQNSEDAYSWAETECEIALEEIKEDPENGKH